MSDTPPDRPWLQRKVLGAYLRAWFYVMRAVDRVASRIVRWIRRHRSNVELRFGPHETHAERAAAADRAIARLNARADRHRATQGEP